MSAAVPCLFYVNSRGFSNHFYNILIGLKSSQGLKWNVITYPIFKKIDYILLDLLCKVPTKLKLIPNY